MIKRQIKRCFAILAALILSSGTLQAAQTPAAVSTSPSNPPATLAGQQAIAKQIARDRIRELRSDRARLMPYLDKGYIRYEINKERVRQKEQFLSGGKKELKELIDRAIQVHTPARASKERI